jgi:hypothetical protein
MSNRPQRDGSVSCRRAVSQPAERDCDTGTEQPLVGWAEKLKPESPHGTVMAVSMMKDEAPYLLEWVAHHLAVGFTDILVYTNDCTDGTVEMLERLEALGLAHHRANTFPEGGKPQPSAVNHAQREPLVAAADWVMLFDADEYLCINHPSGTLSGMLDDAVALGANGIVVTWRIFGSGGIVDWSRTPVTEQYQRAAPPLWNKGWGVKTLFQFDPEFWKLGIHRPTIRKRHIEDGFADSVHWLNGSGRPMDGYFRFRGWRSIRRNLGYDWAQMNHYPVKSVDAYALRRARGNVNFKKDKYNATYWALQDRNEVGDRSILRHAPGRARIMAALLGDPVLAELHEAALAHAEGWLAEFRRTDAYRALRDSLIEASKVPITEVEANPPKPRDPARIAALMSAVEAHATGAAARPRDASTADQPGWAAPGVSPYVAAPIDLSEDIAVEWVANHGLLLPADPRIFAAIGLDAVLAGKFERRHARNIAGYLDGCRRLLEIGTGIGFLAMKALGAVDGLTVMAQDARPGMIPAARRVAAQNGFDDSARLKLVDGPLGFPGDGPDRASGLAALLADFRPDTLRIAEATASPAALAALLPGGLDRVIVPALGAEAIDTARGRLGPVLAAAGFAEDADRSEAGSLLWRRADAAAGAP